MASMKIEAIFLSGNQFWHKLKYEAQFLIMLYRFDET
jgi:hypothetical protein